MPSVSFLFAAMVLAAPPATEPHGSPPTSGELLFRTHCAVCHGTDGRGDGPLSDVLTFRPADLTRIAARSGGAFPAERVQAIIDGRRRVKGHGGSGMPIWGDAFKSPEDGYGERTVKEKIGALVEYLRGRQSPPAK